MTSGQWRVVVLLLVLLGLETLRNGAVKTFLTSIFVAPFKQAVKQ